MGGLGREAMGRAIEEVWGIPDALRDVSFAGATDGSIATRVAPGRDRAAMWRRYLEILDELVADRSPEPLPGVLSLLDRLAARGARLGVLTGNIRAGAAIKLRCARLLDRFDFERSGFGDDGESRADVAAAARRRCGDGITVVGDTPADVACARHIGARVLGVETGFADPGTLGAAGPDRLVADLTATDDLAAWLLRR